jgi:hypothetical protein
VLEEVEMVMVEGQLGVQEAGEKAAVAPEGRPVAEKETATGFPDFSVMVTFVFAEAPGTVVPEAGESEMSNRNGAFVIVREYVTCSDVVDAVPVTVTE